MTLKEAKKILESEGFVPERFLGVLVEDVKAASWEKIEVGEAMKVVAENGYFPFMEKSKYEERKARLKKEYEKNTKAPGSAENSIKGDLSGNKSIEHCGKPIPGSPLSAVEGIKLKWKDNQNTSENPALAESASQFNDALLDEQAKKIKELTEENEDWKSWHEMQNRGIALSNIAFRNEKNRLGKEIARLNKIIHKKNFKIEELRKESYRHLRGKMKMFGENFDLEQELKEKLADKVVDKIDAQALKSAESALAWKEKVIAEKDMAIAYNKKEIADLGEKLAATKKELEGANNLVEIVRKGSEEYCEYGIAAEKMIQKMAKDIVDDRPVSSKDYEQYRLWAKGYRFNPQLPERTDEEEKKLNTAKSTLDDLKEKAYNSFNAKAHNLGLVGNKDGNGIIDQMVGADIAEEGGDQSATIVQCDNGITLSKEEGEIIERCTKNGTELHYSEKDGLTYTNVFGKEMPIRCLRSMFRVFTDEEIENMKK